MSSMRSVIHDQPRLRDALMGTVEPVAIILSWIVAGLATGSGISRLDVLACTILVLLTYPGRWIPVRSLNDVVDLLSNWLVVLTFMALVVWASDTIDRIDRDRLWLWALGTPLLIIFATEALMRVLRWITRHDAYAAATVIVGIDKSSLELAAGIRKEDSGMRLLGFFDDRSIARHLGGHHETNLGPLSSVADYVRRYRVKRVYVALPMTSHPRIEKLLDHLSDSTAAIYFVPDIFTFDLARARLTYVENLPVLAVWESPLFGYNMVLKRASDIVLSVFFILIFFPVMLLIAAAIRIDSPGPVLFRQQRYGVDGRLIRVWKFRTMTVCEDGTSIEQARRGDVRLTRIGGWLRRSSLDELPQFFNVLAGSMSVVGPRPHAVAHNEEYRKLIKGYMLRHLMKPGITGWAQVNGCRGETETVEKMAQRVAYDLEYLRSWSLRLDLAILFRTPIEIVTCSNAF